jgi:hypothetical protein
VNTLSADILIPDLNLKPGSSCRGVNINLLSFRYPAAASVHAFLLMTFAFVSYLLLFILMIYSNIYHLKKLSEYREKPNSPNNGQVPLYLINFVLSPVLSDS